MPFELMRPVEATPSSPASRRGFLERLQAAGWIIPPWGQDGARFMCS